MPTTTALACPSRMAFSAILRQTPKLAQAPTGAIDRPVMPPRMEICAAEMLGMFHSSLASTLVHGSGGQP